MNLIPEEIKDKIKESVDVDSLLIYLGFKIVRSTDFEIRAPCIIHRGDNPTAFSLRRETKKWKCFTKKCELSSSGKIDNDVISLVMKTQGSSFIDSLQFLADFSGLGIDLKGGEFKVSSNYGDLKSHRKFIKTVDKLRKSEVVPSKFSEETIQAYKLCRDNYFTKEGFLESTLDHFDVGSTVSYRGVPSAAIPIRDKSGMLVGLSLRRTDSDADPRYDLEWQFDKENHLYNLHSAKVAGEEFIVVVEGFKACWAVYEAGFPNVVACMGSVVTHGQAALFNSLQTRGCILMLDGDEAGRSGMESSFNKLNVGCKVVKAELPDGAAPDDISRDELKSIISKFKTEI